jgi:hypothetical protein
MCVTVFASFTYLLTGRDTERAKKRGKAPSTLESRHANGVKACGARYDAKLVTNYYCYYS